MLIKYSLATALLLTSITPALAAPKMADIVVAQATQDRVQERIQERQRKQLFGEGDGNQYRVREQEQNRASKWTTNSGARFGIGSRSGDNNSGGGKRGGGRR